MYMYESLKYGMWKLVYFKKEILKSKTLYIKITFQTDLSYIMMFKIIYLIGKLILKYKILRDKSLLRITYKWFVRER